MGKIIEADFNKLVPTQEGLKKWQFEDLVKDYFGEFGNIIIPVRKHPEFDKYLILDGHHATSMMYLLKDIYDYKLYLWVAENKRDYVEIKDRNFYKNLYSKGTFVYNENIRTRFDEVLINFENPNYPKSIEELISQHSWSSSPEKLFKLIY